MNAREIYKMWHDKEVSETYKVSVPELDDAIFHPIGTGTEIMYRSAKWEKKPFDYVHGFGSPLVYLLSSHIPEEERRGRGRKVSSLLGRKPTNKPLELARLGEVLEVSFKDSYGESVSLLGVSGADLLSTPNKKALLLLTKKGPVFITGGKMCVTARGIVD